MSGSHVSQNAPGDTGKERENPFVRYGQGRGQSRSERDGEAQQDGRPDHPGPIRTRRQQDRGQRDAYRYLVDEDTQPDEPGGDRGGLRADAEDETVGEVVDREPRNERAERVLANVLLW